ncbi:MAG TPA: histidine kinase [Mycobacteriales bacterium]|nr:histidine kinase [Mycobacteriales bacterium]
MSAAPVIATDEPELWLEEPWAWVLPVRQFVDRHPLLVDLAAAFVLDAITAIPLLYGESRWWVWLLDQALILPLVARRKRPFAVFWLIAVVAFVQWLADVPLAADGGLLVALYTVAEHQSRARALVAAGVLEIGVVLASLRFAPPGESLVSSLVLLTGMVTAALFVGMALRTRRAYLASVVDRAARLEAERDHQTRLAATRERTRIAREMHDIVAHSLSVIIALADGAALSNDQDSAAASEAMRTVSATGRQSMTEMGRLLGVLRDDEEPWGLAPQPGLDRVPDLVERLRNVGPRLDVEVIGEPRWLPPTADATAYRIIQESLTNVVKHATGATKVCLQLDWRPHELAIDIIDNGSPVSASRPAPGHGLNGMSERVAVFAGNFTAGPLDSGGWRVCARLPIGAE